MVTRPDLLAVAVATCLPCASTSSKSTLPLPINIIRKLSPENAAIYASLPEGVARQLTLDRDPHGNVQVSLIETEKLLSEMVATKLAAWKEEGKFVGKFASQHHFFGYEGRCAAPSNYDADYCYSLGYTRPSFRI